MQQELQKSMHFFGRAKALFTEKKIYGHQSVATKFYIHAAPYQRGADAP
jgi:hypothetical protein